MLREIGKRNVAVLEAFLGEHCRMMPRTALRYAIERLPDEKRRAYLKGSRRHEHQRRRWQGPLDNEHQKNYHDGCGAQRARTEDANPAVIVLFLPFFPARIKTSFGLF
jgi:hypothetical protein